MAIYLKRLLFAFIALQIQNTIGNKKPWYCKHPLAGSDPGRFDPEKYKQHLVGTTIIAPKNGVNASASTHEASTEEDQLNLIDIPEISSREELEHIFTYIRDTKFVVDCNGVPRRLSWLYPDDGCYRRVELATREIFAAGMRVPKKIFGVGWTRLITVQTANKTGGSVSWAYHVALIYLLEGVAFVLDPSLEPNRPLSLHEWNLAFGGSHGLGYSICSPTAYGITNKCYGIDLRDENMYEEQLSFLHEEWRRLEELGRSPEEELGDNPPWPIINKR